MGGLLPALLSALCVSETAAMLNKDGFPLPMSFEASSDVMVIFSWWRTRTPAQYGLCCFLCGAFGFISVALKVLRRISEQYIMLAEDRGELTLIFGSFPIFHNAIRGTVAFLNYAWDYMLMLVAMTFNAGVFMSLIGGIGLGFLLIGDYLDYVPERRKVASVCECDKGVLSCGCHRGQPCTCCKTAKFIHAGRDAQVGISAPLAAQRGVCLTAGTCGRPASGV